MDIQKKKVGHKTPAQKAAEHLHTAGDALQQAGGWVKRARTALASRATAGTAEEQPTPKKAKQPAPAEAVAAVEAAVPRTWAQRAYRALRYVGLGLAVVTTLSVFAVLWSVYALSTRTGADTRQTLQVLINPDPASNLRTDQFGHINILLMGRGGQGHQGGDLVDSFMVASVSPSDNSVSVLSIPRDLWLRLPGTLEEDRLNSMLYHGKRKYGGNELEAMAYPRLAAEKLTGMEIQYTMLIDFQAFIEVVEAVGGIDIYLEREFLDRNFPLHDFSGEEVFWLPQGANHLSGYNALKFARSRHSTSDFSRAQRQQMIVQALIDEFITQGVVTSPDKITEIFNIVKDNMVTDMTLPEMLAMGKLAVGIPRDHMSTAVLNNRCAMEEQCDIAGLLYNPERRFFGGASILLPVGTTIYNLENYDNIHKFAQIFFYHPQVVFQRPAIGVYNATNSSGLAYRLKNYIGPYGYIVKRLASTENRQLNLERTTIYAPDPAAQKDALYGLSLLLDADIIQGPPPLAVTLDHDIDIYVVLGKDAVGARW